MILESFGLTLTLYSRVAFDTENRAREMVDYLLKHPRFAPDRGGAFEPLRRLNAERIEQAVFSLVNRAGQEEDPERVMSGYSFERRRDPACSHSIRWERLPHVAFTLSLYRIKEEHIQNAVQINEWLDFTVGVLDRHEAWYAHYALDEEIEEKHFLEWFYLRRKMGDQKKIGRAHV